MASSPSPLKTPLKGVQLKSDVHAEWCPGCGDFGITNAIQQAVAGMGLKPWETFVSSGVGCAMAYTVRPALFNYARNNRSDTGFMVVFGFRLGKRR